MFYVVCVLVFFSNELNLPDFFKDHYYAIMKYQGWLQFIGKWFPIVGFGDRFSKDVLLITVHAGILEGVMGDQALLEQSLEVGVPLDVS